LNPDEPIADFREIGERPFDLQQTTVLCFAVQS